MRILSNFTAFSTLGLCVLSLSGVATNAQAGFEWIPSLKVAPPPAKETPVMPAAPMVSVGTPQTVPAPMSENMTSVDPMEKILPLPLAPQAMNKPQAVMAEKPMVSVSGLEHMDKTDATPVMKQRVILSENAPNRAVSEIKSQNGKMLTINPFPQDMKPVSAQMAALSVAEAATPMMPEATMPTTAAPAPMAKPSTTVSMPEPTDVNVVGFGTDMPLALALRQVVPPQYSFAFSKSVNPGYRVSWNGGKSWIDVVQDMVEPLALTAELRGKTLHITSPAGEVMAQEPIKTTRTNITDPGMAEITPPPPNSSAL